MANSDLFIANDYGLSELYLNEAGPDGRALSL